MTLRRPRSRPGTALAVSGALAVLVAITVGVGACGGADPDRVARLEVVVPAGTGARLDAGEPVELIPRTVKLVVGGRLVIENRDDRTHIVGPFSVRAGETVDKVFDESGRYQGACTIHPAGEVTIDVR